MLVRTPCCDSVHWQEDDLGAVCSGSEQANAKCVAVVSGYILNDTAVLWADGLRSVRVLLPAVHQLWIQLVN